MQIVVEADGSYKSVDDILNESMVKVESNFDKLDLSIKKLESIIKNIDEILKK